jgi:hypothetical protein
MYLVEVRDAEGHLDSEREKAVKIEHSYLFSKIRFSIDEMCYYASFGQGRDNPSGPMQLPEFMSSIGVSYRLITW